MGEKTPAHLYYVDELLEWFPDARVIHCMRDPRAIHVSELRRRTEHAVGFPYRQLTAVPALMERFVLLEVVWAWARAVHRHRVLADRYPGRYRLLRFEDLVARPRATLDGLCDFLGVTAEPRMLEQKVTSRGARVGSAGFDAAAAERWRERIDPGAQAAIERLLGRRLAQRWATRAASSRARVAFVGHLLVRCRRPGRPRACPAQRVSTTGSGTEVGWSAPWVGQRDTVARDRDGSDVRAPLPQADWPAERDLRAERPCRRTDWPAERDRQDMRDRQRHAGPRQRPSAGLAGR